MAELNTQTGYFELIQTIEYIPLKNLVTISLNLFNDFIEAICFLAYNFKKYSKAENNYFYDLKGYDPICDFLSPPIMPNHQVTSLLQKLLILKKLPDKEQNTAEYELLSQIAVHRESFEKIAEMTFLTDEQADILMIKPKEYEGHIPFGNDADKFRNFIELIADPLFLTEDGKLLSYSKLHTKLSIRYARTSRQIPSKNTIKRYANE